jgi:transketolase
MAMEQKTTPSCLIFSRQNLAFMARSAETVANIRKGGYILKDAAQPRAVLIATGSEVALAMQAAETLAAQNIAVRVVSMPSTNVFDAQDKAYKISILGENVPRLAIEAGVSDFWRKYVGLEGDVIGIDQFGESAPADQLFKLFGFTVENVVAKVTNLIV